MSDPETYTFRGRNVPEAMAKLTASLGRDAFILEKRHVKPEGGLLGGLLGGGEVVEIVATPSPEVARARSPRRDPATLVADDEAASARGARQGYASDDGAYGGGSTGGNGGRGLLARTYAGAMGDEADLDVPMDLFDSKELILDGPILGEGLRRRQAEAGGRSFAEAGMRGGSRDGRTEAVLASDGPTPRGRDAGNDGWEGAVGGGGGAGITGGFAALCAEGEGRILAGLREELRKMMSLQARGHQPVVGERLLEAYQCLVENDVAADIARDLVERLQREMPIADTFDPEAVRASMVAAIDAMIGTTGPIQLREAGDRPTVVALVGPTGVGKTSTIVKMAFEYNIKRHKKVGFITEDVRRPGAEAQLKSLAHLLNLPLVAAETPARVVEEINHLSDLDLILIDTGGRAPRDEAGIAELADFLAAAQPDETHLVLSSESAERSVLQTIERFRVAGFDRVVVSKLDETASYGLIVNVAQRVGEGLSYVTTGQQYTETLRESDGEHLARLVLGLERVEATRPVHGRA